MLNEECADYNCDKILNYTADTDRVNMNILTNNHFRFITIYLNMNGIETPEVYKNHNVAPEVPKHLCDHSESQIVHYQGIDSRCCLIIKN